MKQTTPRYAFASGWLTAWWNRTHAGEPLPPEPAGLWAIGGVGEEKPSDES